MVLPLPPRLLPFTVRVALEPEIGALPRIVLPSEKATTPVGKALPLAALTVAVSCVDPVNEMIEGLAPSDVIVTTGGAVTVTVVELLEPKKLPVAV
jgi:hypothetical protein